MLPKPRSGGRFLARGVNRAFRGLGHPKPWQGGALASAALERDVARIHEDYGIVADDEPSPLAPTRMVVAEFESVDLAPSGRYDFCSVAAGGSVGAVSCWLAASRLLQEREYEVCGPPSAVMR